MILSPNNYSYEAEAGEDNVITINGLADILNMEMKLLGSMTSAILRWHICFSISMLG